MNTPDWLKRAIGSVGALSMLVIGWLGMRVEKHPRAAAIALAVLAVIVAAWLIVDLWSAIVLAVLALVGWGAWRLLVKAERS